ncbi:hypothetical protein BABINDRAFT_13290 [Babjeviella inositovora NRRL Y-12698]|uniref:Transcription factor BYE1 n=1 Tax=Babjeviella inositovora NRRL Y-12698 TaxID=984486 RepID=A0A1E3QSG3_9ASCO|nr:uncharacterized protein BABINDRAFT_13290 [Babjeviella inositovora NRRL Y-12698]ODQ80444.1 hypothetical protein BABINDRAFT_13290 [Babjeviella inositovora NRRL Y-12698]
MEQLVRRSGRLNKGVNRHIEEDVPKRKPVDISETGKTNAEVNVRCLVCGTNGSRNPGDEKEKMAQCQQCRTWQHVFCLFGHRALSKLPKHYLCNVCKPDFPKYKSLVFQIDPIPFQREEERKQAEAQVEKDNGDDNEAYKEEAEEDDVDARVNDLTEGDDLAEAEGEVNEASEAEGTRKHQKAEARSTKRQKVGSAKDGSVESGAQSDISTKPSTPVKPPTTDKFSFLKDKTRRAVAQQFLNIIQTQSPAQNSPQDAIAMALGIEQEVFKKADSFDQDESYTHKSRSLFANLKNPKLRLLQKVFDGELSVEKLVSLKPDEMRSEEMAEYAEKIKQEAIAQSVLKSDEPTTRTKRTHKGEEIIEEDTDTSSFDPQYRKESESPVEHERTLTPEVVQIHYQPTSNDDFVPEPHHSDTPDDFIDQSDMLHLDGLESILEEGQPDSLDLITKDVNAKKTSKRVHFALDEESDDDYDPFSTVQLTSSLAAFWKGGLSFPGIAHADCLSALLGSTVFMPLASVLNVAGYLLLASHYEIEGRLDADKAESYLQKILSTRDLFLAELSPNLASQLDYDQLWEYFHSRQKYGVINARQPWIKDSYIVPLNPGDAAPVWLLTIKAATPDIHVESYVQSSRRLYCIFVTKKNYVPEYEESPVPNLDDVLSKLN